MVKTIDMQDMRYLNLFGKITKVSTRFCFTYNGMIIFCVPKSLVFKAVGEGGMNVRKISSIIGKKIRIIPKPRGIQDAKSFIISVVSPANFKELELKDDELIIIAGGTQNKAILLGRDKKRLFELQKIIGDFFEKELRIV